MRYLWGLFALLVMVSGEARAFDWSTEPDLREVADHSEHGGIDFGNLWPEWEKPRQTDSPRGGWVLGDFEPPEDGTPTFPPDPHPFPECPEGDVWTCPKGQPFPEGCVCLMWPDGRSAKLVDGGGNIEWISPREGRPTLEEFEDYLHATGWFDTEDGADDTPTLDDPSEFVEHNPLGTEYRGGSPLQTEGEDPTPSETPTAAPVEATPEPTPAVCPPNTTPTLFGFCIGYWTPFGDWRTTEDTCVVKVTDQPVHVDNPDGSQAAYLGGCETVTCPNEAPVTTCCAAMSWGGEVTCPELPDGAVVTPYTLPPSSLDDLIDLLDSLGPAEGIPAGWEGPWRR